MRILSSDEALLSLFRFLDLYCIESENPAWRTAELLLLNRVPKLPIEVLVPIIECLAN